ncbi:MAG TPA: RsmB/NOP family class I SAM-dependent RNA methyltransferase [Anaeromyxobacteraceae bacterium]|nr:RsmB/NOP family class I SAM-dependent RNA methyltransferase [Anaeromyxobacteraceae bacterium]
MNETAHQAGPFPDASVRRLASLPWEALETVAADLDGPIGRVLGGEAAERVLDRLLRDQPGLGGPGRRAAAEAVFGVGLWRRRLAWHLGREEAAPRLFLASLLRDLARLRGDASEALCALAPGSLPPPRPPPPDLARFHSLPDWLAAILAREAGDEAAALADALNRPGPACLRANRARATREDLAARLEREGLAVRRGRLAPDALLVETPGRSLLPLPSFREGLFEVQDEGSQLAGEAVAARPGDEVLDLCAGAGGKTLQLAAALGGRGRVHAADPDGERLDRLRRRAARAGVAGLVEVCGAAPPAGLRVSRVLVDAPCSELGALRRGPDLRFRLDPGSFGRFPPLQRALLEAALGHLGPRGRLVYATCTLRREENEEVALEFERSHPELRRAPAARDPSLLGADGFLRLWPHRHDTDGFFAAAWERRA